MGRPFEGGWHPVKSLRAVSWAYPTPGTRERFAVIHHLQDEDGWAFWAVTVAGDRLGPYETLEATAMDVHQRAMAAGKPNVTHSHSGPSTVHG